MAMYPNGRYATLTAGRKFGPGAGLDVYNRNNGERLNCGLGSFAAVASVPDGYGIRALIPAREAGGLSACNTIIGSGGAFGPVQTARNIAATLTGDGGVSSGVLGLIVSIAATLAGSGGVSSAATQALATLTAALAGTGSVSATAAGLAALTATLTGSGAVAANNTALMDIRATIVGYGDATAQGIRDAVWSAAAAQFNAPGSMGNKLNSAASGGVDLSALAAAVWSHVTRTLTAGGAAPTAEEVATAVRAELAVEMARIDALISSRVATGATVPADVVKMNGADVIGDGSEADPWRGSGVSP